MSSTPTFVAREVRGPYRSPGDAEPIHWVVTTEISEVHERDHWTGRAVTVDRLGACLVVATERIMHAPPWRPGEPIGLLVKAPSRGRPGVARPPEGPHPPRDTA